MSSFAVNLSAMLIVGSAYIFVRIIGPFVPPLMSKRGAQAEAQGVVVKEEQEEDGKTTLSKRALLLRVVYLFLVLLILIPFTQARNPGFLVNPKPGVTFGMNLLGAFVPLLVILWTVDLSVLILHVSPCLSSRQKQFLVSSKRRKVTALASLVLWITLSAAAIGVAYATPNILEIEIPLPNLDPCLDGYTIAFLSDIHGGPLVGRRDVQKVVDIVTSVEPDVVLLAGDIADGEPDLVGQSVDLLADFQVPDGVFFTSGNHEFLHGGTGETWSAFWTALNVTVLDSERVALPRNPSDGCSQFDLIGVPDFGRGEPNLAAALDGRDESVPSVLVAHQPNQSTEAEQLGIDLQLSGHTHHGHLFPIHGLTLLSNTHFGGLEQSGSMLIYVSAGVFGWGPRVRLGSKNEITLVRLRSPAVSDIQVDTSPIGPLIIAYLSFPFWIGGLFLMVSRSPCVVCPLRKKFNYKELPL